MTPPPPPVDPDDLARIRAELEPALPEGALRALRLTDGTLHFVLDLAGAAGVDAPALLAQTRDRALRLPGVGAVEGRLATPAPAPELPPGPAPIEGVARIIVVGSGKGGVGKSTVSANLALALADRGLRVGLLDADIHGPSVPMMLGANGRPIGRGDRIVPLAAHGIKALSVGMLMAPDRALVWRGPMLVTALRQMLHEVLWAPLDVLVIDLPPGTGDVPVTLAQTVPIAGAVVVTTPQDVALIDARRALDLFAQTEVPVLGLIENMSSHVCSRCGQEDDVFGHGGGAAEAEARGIPFLGALPLSRPLRETGDAGTPIVRADPASPAATRFAEIAARLAEGWTAGG